MGRNKLIETEELKQFALAYAKLNPGTRITIPKLGDFIRATRPEIRDALIRRDKDFRAFLDKYNDSIKEKRHVVVSGFKTMNVKKFIGDHPTPEELSDALQELDLYYKTVAASAADIFSENRTNIRKIKDLESEVNSLKAENEKLTKKNARLRVELDRMSKIAEKLQNVVDGTYKGIATQLLSEEGLYDEPEGISADSVDSVTITAEKEIAPFENDEVNELLRYTFDEKDN
jgi:uncharacterized coiled-coil DUF342 family protein